MRMHPILINRLKYLEKGINSNWQSLPVHFLSWRNSFSQLREYLFAWQRLCSIPYGQSRTVVRMLLSNLPQEADGVGQ